MVSWELILPFAGLLLSAASVGGALFVQKKIEDIVQDDPYAFVKDKEDRLRKKSLKKKAKAQKKYEKKAQKKRKQSDFDSF